MHEARRRARAAAEQRKVLTAGSGQKLGGAPIRRGEDVRQVIANAAARRAAVIKGCASGTTREREKEIVDGSNKRGVRTKATQDDANEEAIMIAYIDLVQEEEREKYGDAYIPPSKENPAGSRGLLAGKSKAEDIASAELARLRTKDKAKQSPPPIPTSTKPNANPPSAPSTRSKPPASTIDLTNPALAPTPSSWTCDICTLVNPTTCLFCDACGIERPSPPSSPLSSNNQLPDRPKPSSLRDTNAVKAVRKLRELDEREKGSPQKPLGWLCQRCGQFMELEWWTCANCGEMKASS